ncbi:MAG: hypothetical protein ACJ8GW_19925 [Massilia sp.]
MKSIFSILCLFLTATAHAANSDASNATQECKIINPHPVAGETVTWSGACKDGYAEGEGTLEWLAKGVARTHFEGTLVRGRYQGQAYLRVADRYQFDGSFVDGERHGKGTELQIDLTRYEGNWKHGQFDGEGSATFANGGSYVGQWKDGKVHGHGKLTYTSGKVVEGEFVAGLPAGQSAAPAPGAAPAARHRLLDMDSSGPPATVANSNIPFRRSWSSMSAQEQASVREAYGALSEDDEPPYPARGVAAMYQGFAEGQGIVQAKGLLRMNVTIDKNGAPVKTRIFATPDAALAKYAAIIVMNEKFKPALCAGIPCEMIFPISVIFGTRL